MNEFKLIVAGGRDFASQENYWLLEANVIALAEGPYADRAVSIVSGMARGADALAVRFAKIHNVMLHEFPADWDKGKHAGFLRNVDMAEFSDGLLAFWDGSSRGTAHMIKTMELHKKPVHIVRY